MSRAWLAALLAAACSSLVENEDGVATLEIRVPANVYLEHGVTTRLEAAARNRAGEVVDVRLTWRTPDTTVTLDRQTGDITPRQSTGSARVQVAAMGKDTLASSLSGLVFTLTARADSLRLVGPDSLDVRRDADSSAALDVRLVALPEGTGVSGRPIGFRIVDPAPGGDTVVLLGRGLVRDSVLSTGTGGPPAPVRVWARAGRVPPDRVVVEATAYRASGAPIPGSGIRFVIRFRHEP